MKTLGERLRAIRDELDIGLPTLAERVSQEMGGEKVSYQTLQQLEGGNSRGTKYLVPLARALGRRPDWLFDETGPEFPERPPPEASLVGYVGAGDEIFRFEEGPSHLGGIAPPPGMGECNAARIRGTSQDPLQDGWIVFYGQENQGVSIGCLGKLCVVQVKEGPTLLKTVKRGTKRNHFHLTSWNAPQRKDVPLLWASRVLDIRPT